MPEPMTLSHIEKMALDGLAAQWRLKTLEQRTVEQEFVAEVERRLKLPPGSIGRTHILNQQTGEITPKPDDTPPVAPPAA